MTIKETELLNGCLATLHFVRACQLIGSNSSDAVVDEYILKLTEALKDSE